MARDAVTSTVTKTLNLEAARYYTFPAVPYYSQTYIQATGPSGGAARAMAALLVGSLLNQRGGVA